MPKQTRALRRRDFILAASVLFSGIYSLPVLTEVSCAQASESSDVLSLQTISVQSADTTCSENVLQDAQGYWYFSADTIAKYTGYVFDGDANRWNKYTDGSYQTDKKIFLSRSDALVSVNLLNSTYPVNLSGLYDYGGQLWFPIHQMLPLMETVSWVEDGVLCIETPAVSFEDAFHGWDMSSLMFDEEAEFAGQSWAEAIMVGSAWLYDTVGSLDLGRLLSLVGDGGVDDYETVITDYFTDTDAYELAYGDTDTINKKISSVGKFVSAINTNYGLSMKCLKAIYGICESIEGWLDTTGGSGLFGDIVLSEDTCLVTERFTEVIPDGVTDSLSVAGEAIKLTANCYKMAKNYTLAVQDNKDMLTLLIAGGDEGGSGFWDALKDAITLPSSADAMQQAAANVYSLYSAEDINEFYYNMCEELLLNYVKDDVIWGVVSDAILKSLLGFKGWYSAAAALEKVALDKLWENLGINASDDLALFYHHTNVLDAAYDTFYATLHGGVGATAAVALQEDLEKLRLSALLTLLSSKKCFEILRDNNLKNTEFVSYCNTRIDNITTRLAFLYLAGECVLTDGIEYFNSAIPVLASELEGLKPVEASLEMGIWRAIYTTQFWPTSQDMPLGQVYTRYDMLVSDITLEFADLNGDGAPEMIVLASGTPLSGDESPVVTLEVLKLTDDDYGYTSLYKLRVEGTDMLGVELQCGFALDAQGRYGLLLIRHTEVQGSESSSYSFYGPDRDGTFVEIDSGTDTSGGDLSTRLSSLYSDTSLLLVAQGQNDGSAMCTVSGMPASFWFSYVYEKESLDYEYEEEDVGVEDGVPAERKDYVVAELTSYTYHGSIGDTSFMVLFDGDASNMTMYVMDVMGDVDLSIPVKLSFGMATDAQIVDYGALASSLSSFISVSDYSMYYEPEVNEIYIFFEDGSTSVFTSYGAGYV